MLDNETKEIIQKHLRTADEFCRMKNFTEAISEIEKVFQYDSKNQLARTFIEKVRMIQKQMQEPAPQVGKRRELTAQEKMKILPEHFREIQLAMGRKDFHRASELINEVYTIDPDNFYAKAYAEKIADLEKSDAAKKVTILQQPREAPKEQSDPYAKGSSYMYCELMKEFWFDGKLNVDEISELTTVRDMFGITQEEHKVLEQGIKLQSFIDALQIAWKNNTNRDKEQNILDVMCHRFAISAEDYRTVEAKVEVVRRSRASRGVVLFVDYNQAQVAEAMKELNDHNFEAMITDHIENVVDILFKRMPLAVISEMIFAKKGYDGFTLHRKLLGHVNYKDIPFFITTSLKNEKIVRATIRTGVTGVFYKPIDSKLLLAEIERLASGKKK